ncbi:MAG: class I SAM-dependent methyltransferase [Acidobacteriaceae bacterium]
MNRLEHWQNIHASKPSNQVSWFAPHLEVSLHLIDRLALPASANIIDIGSGQSTLPDDLLTRGYFNLTLLDISPAAIHATRRRLGPSAASIRFLAADITTATLPKAHYDLWHDRAVFHFLTAPQDRAAYLGQLTHALKPGGHVLLATFGPQGPTRCSNLDVVRYDAPTLQRELGSHFHLNESATHLHHTPSGSTQQFLYCHFQLTAPTP